jgi:UDP-glucose 4,6-dehydratase
VTFTIDNVLGTHHLLEVLKANKHKIRRFVHVSTDEVYGENQSYSDAADKKVEATSALDPTNPYAASKAAAEMMVKSYHRSYGLPILVTRGNNVYGNRQFPEKLIPKMIMMVSKGKKLTVHGEGQSKRSYLHVSDVAAAFDVILHKGKVGDTYNIGTDEEHSVIEIVKKILAIMRPSANPDDMIEYVRDRPFNDMRYYLDLKQLDILGWKKQINFDDGLKQVVEWFVANAGSFWLTTDMDSILVGHPTASNSASQAPVAPIEMKSEEPAAKKSKKVKFLIFGKTGWIGGMLGKLLSDRSYEFEYATSRLQDRERVER